MTDQTLSPRGGWVMIKKELPTQIQPPLLSIWYAMPDRLFPAGWHTDPFGSRGHELGNRDMLQIWRHRYGAKNLMPDEIAFAEKYADLKLEQRVRIVTPEGDVCVEPYEWTPIPEISKYFDAIGDGYTLHEFGDTQKTSSKMEEQLFYMQTRGLDRASALRLLIGDVKKQNVVWLECDPQYISYFFGPRERKRTNPAPMRVELNVEGLHA